MLDDGYGWDEPAGLNESAGQDDLGYQAYGGTGHSGYGGHDDPGLPGDDLIILAMLDEDEERQRGGTGPGYGPAGGCCGCLIPVFLLTLLGTLAAVVTLGHSVP